MTKLTKSYLQATILLKGEIEKAFLTLGERLYKIYSENLWEGSYNSYAEFLSDMDMNEGQASKLRQIYERFVLEYGLKHTELAEVGQKKLYTILPLCSDKNSAQAQIERIQGLTSNDVEKMVKAEKVGEHEHVWVKTQMCEVCKKVERNYD